MSVNIIKKILVVLIIVVFHQVQAQRCDKKNYCDKGLYGEYDYRSQSNYSQVYTGDTLRVKVVVYAKQSYRIFTCADRKLKKVHFNIIFPEKRFKRIIKNVVTKEVPIYEKNKNGKIIFNDKGEKILTGTIFANDTVWGRQLVTSEKIVYNSEKEKNKFWDALIHKTRLIIIEVIIPEQRKKRPGCIQIMVGREKGATNQFRR